MIISFEDFKKYIINYEVNFSNEKSEKSYKDSNIASIDHYKEFLKQAEKAGIKYYQNVQIC
jgi:hypothetical protein